MRLESRASKLALAGTLLAFFSAVSFVYVAPVYGEMLVCVGGNGGDPFTGCHGGHVEKVTVVTGYEHTLLCLGVPLLFLAICSFALAAVAFVRPGTPPPPSPPW